MNQYEIIYYDRYDNVTEIRRREHPSDIDVIHYVKRYLSEDTGMDDDYWYAEVRRLGDSTEDSKFQRRVDKF